MGERIIIALVVCFAIGSCSYMGIERDRLLYEAKQKCWDNGGNWNGFSTQCDRPAEANHGRS